MGISRFLFAKLPPPLTSLWRRQTREGDIRLPLLILFLNRLRASHLINQTAKKKFCCLSTSALVRGWFNNDSSLHWERSTRQCAHICRDNLRLACVQTPTSSQKQFEGYMRSNNLRLPCVQTPTSVEIRPLKLKSRSFGEIFGNFNVVSLFVPRLEEAILTQLLMKIFEGPSILGQECHRYSPKHSKVSN